MRWIVAALADGATHLGTPTDDRRPVQALCGATIHRPLAILNREPDKTPPDPAQACPDCARLRGNNNAVAHYLRSQPQPGNAVLLVRLKPGVIGECRRVVHVVPAPKPGSIPEVLIAYCGEQIRPGTAERLDDWTGMPCEKCGQVATTTPNG